MSVNNIKTVKHDKPTRPKDYTPTRRTMGDGFMNHLSNLGVGAENQLSGTGYVQNKQVSWDRATLDALYRQSWVVNKAVSVIAEDMVREGIDITAQSFDPGQIESIQRELVRDRTWEHLEEAVKWARLYGGACCVMLIEGQDLSTPLNPSTIAPGQFKGLYVLDRWVVWPSTAGLNSSVETYGPDYGLPKYYRISTGDYASLDNKIVHYSRVLRFTGHRLPYWQAIRELFWGQSIVESMYDRMIAYDNVTFGIAQLVSKSYLRVQKIPGLTESLATGGDSERNALMDRMLFLKLLQGIEGVSVMDAEEDMTFASFTFSGLKDVLIQMAEQVAAASEVPMTKFFGQAPSGLSATGEYDQKNYYDMIAGKQEKDLRHNLDRLFQVLIPSVLGVPMPRDFNFKFRPLAKMTDSDLATIAASDITAAVAATDAGIYTPARALEEIRRSGLITGRGSTITDEDIESAKDVAPIPGEIDLASFDPEAEATPNDGFSDSFAKKNKISRIINHFLSDKGECEQWITTESGAHICLGSDGEVKGGAGGALNGEKMTNAKTSAPKKTNAKTSAPKKTVSLEQAVKNASTKSLGEYVAEGNAGKSNKVSAKAILNYNKKGLDQGGAYTEDQPEVIKVAAELGAKGIDLSKQPIVSGYRYGPAPSGGISKNHAESKSENGLSMASVEGSSETGTTQMFFGGRKKVKVKGVLLPYTGSDDEPLILPIDSVSYLD